MHLPLRLFLCCFVARSTAVLWNILFNVFRCHLGSVLGAQSILILGIFLDPRKRRPQDGENHSPNQLTIIDPRPNIDQTAPKPHPRLGLWLARPPGALKEEQLKNDPQKRRGISHASARGPANYRDSLGFVKAILKGIVQRNLKGFCNGF